MAKKKTEKFMTPKKGHTFYKGVRRFQPGDKIPEAFLKNAEDKALKFPALEEWQEPKGDDSSETIKKLEIQPLEA